MKNSLSDVYKELHDEYKPYLRSLPKKLDQRKCTMLNGDWMFRFEVMNAQLQFAVEGKTVTGDCAVAANSKTERAGIEY